MEFPRFRPQKIGPRYDRSTSKASEVRDALYKRWTSAAVKLWSKMATSSRTPSKYDSMPNAMAALTHGKSSMAGSGEIHRNSGDPAGFPPIIKDPAYLEGKCRHSPSSPTCLDIRSESRAKGSSGCILHKELHIQAKLPVEHGTCLSACTTLHHQPIGIDPDRGKTKILWMSHCQ